MCMFHHINDQIIELAIIHSLLPYLYYCTNTKLCVSVNAVVCDLCKITEPRKKEKVYILHNLQEF